MNVLGLDIGGANIKAADTEGNCQSVEFPLWKIKHDLAQKIRQMVSRFPEPTRIGLTMTGELADCFRSKQEGVVFIVDAVAELGKRVHVYLTNGLFAGPEDAKKQHQLAAAANWHALASFSARFAKSPHSVLVDIGSTTTDVIPLVNGRVASVGMDDYSRLLSGELIYTGVERSAINGLTRTLQHRQTECPLMNEMFATTLDAYLVLGCLPESDESRGTADGQPRRCGEATRRLARLFGKDPSDFSQDDAIEVAEQVSNIQIGQLNHSLSTVLDRFDGRLASVIVSGQGDFLMHMLLERPSVLTQMGQDPEFLFLTDVIGAELSRCATAFAVATLASEMSLTDFRSTQQVSSVQR